VEDFDVVAKIRELDRRVVALESGAPSANLDAGAKGATLYLGSEFSERLHLALREAGYRTNEDLRAASDQELRKVRGVGSSTLKRIRQALGQPV